MRHTLSSRMLFIQRRLEMEAYSGDNYPYCTYRGPGNVQSSQLEMYNIRRGVAIASQHEKLQNSHEQAVSAARLSLLCPPGE